MKVLLAVEVGSRMWGLESPDSDHDIRFIFASEDLSEYLAVFPRRDTIEVNEAGGKADVCGWDVKKALDLCHRSNAAIVEWLRSPTAVVFDPEFVGSLRTIALTRCSARSIGFSYSSNARNDLEKVILSTREPVPIDYLYVLRPVLNLRWILDHRGSPALQGMLPPVQFLEALDGCSPTVPAEVLSRIRALVEQKRAGLGRAPQRHDVVLEGWVNDVLAEWKSKAPQVPHDEPPRDALDRLFCETVKRVSH